jgi:hypothetical protein
VLSKYILKLYALHILKSTLSLFLNSMLYLSNIINNKNPPAIITCWLVKPGTHSSLAGFDVAVCNLLPPGDGGGDDDGDGDDPSQRIRVPVLYLYYIIFSYITLCCIILYYITLLYRTITSFTQPLREEGPSSLCPHHKGAGPPPFTRGGGSGLRSQMVFGGP